MQRAAIPVAGLLALVGVALVAGCTPQGAPPGSGDTSGGQVKEMTEFRSPAFAPNTVMPARFATRAVPGGANVSIPYEWSGAPAGTKSFAIAIVDRSPVAHDWVHWLVVDIPPATSALVEGASGTAQMPAGARELTSTFGTHGYGGPQPPPGTGLHPYEATLYALDVASLDLPADAGLAQFERAIAGRVLARSTYTGLFGR